MMHACATLVPLLSGGALAGLAFLAILAFGLLAVMSLTRHVRRSRAPWPGEVDGGVPLVDDVRGDATEARVADRPVTGEPAEQDQSRP